MAGLGGSQGNKFLGAGGRQRIRSLLWGVGEWWCDRLATSLDRCSSSSNILCMLERKDDLYRLPVNRQQTTSSRGRRVGIAHQAI